MAQSKPPGRFRTVTRKPLIRLTRSLLEFLDTEAAGGVILAGATAVALIWANSPWSQAYDRVWGTELSLRLGGFELTNDLRHWINDGFMTLFFFVVGLEIKRELVRGELNEREKAVMPAVAALGGMVLPAVVYLAFNAGGPAARGWGIPMATDIAFSLGVLALLGSRISSSLKIFMLSLAITDDIGAILVIALFYSADLNLSFLGTALGLLLVILLMRSIGITWVPAYAALGVLVWLTVFQSGVHATLAGVALGLMTPVAAVKPLSHRRLRLFGRREEPGEVSPRRVRETKQQLHASASVAERLMHDLHPWTSYVVIPLFALANAGVLLNSRSLGEGLSSKVGLGVAVGLIAGKIFGISLFTWLAHRLSIGKLPSGMTWPQVIGLGGVAGIGFTVALFISTLAFDQPQYQDQAKVGILVGSALSGLLGAAILRGATRPGQEDEQ
jgi:Na+:H+ antiporter, NhaA family